MQAIIIFYNINYFFAVYILHLFGYICMLQINAVHINPAAHHIGE